MLPRNQKITNAKKEFSKSTRMHAKQCNVKLHCFALKHWQPLPSRSFLSHPSTHPYHSLLNFTSTSPFRSMKMQSCPNAIEENRTPEKLNFKLMDRVCCWWTMKKQILCACSGKTDYADIPNAWMQIFFFLLVRRFVLLYSEILRGCKALKSAEM